jgi:hypothetical protein
MFMLTGTPEIRPDSEHGFSLRKEVTYLPGGPVIHLGSIKDGNHDIAFFQSLQIGFEYIFWRPGSHLMGPENFDAFQPFLQQSQDLLSPINLRLAEKRTR